MARAWGRLVGGQWVTKIGSVAAAVAIAWCVVACGGAETTVGAERIGDYAIQQGADGLEIRSIPDQHPTLNRILSRLHPKLAEVGLPSVTLSSTRIVDRGSLGNETEWPRSEVASVVVQHRAKRAVEAKIEAADRSWRVLLLRKNGRPLRNGWGFPDESDARALAAIVGRVLGTTPQETAEPASE
jgi:hypothetical protein